MLSVNSRFTLEQKIESLKPPVLNEMRPTGSRLERGLSIVSSDPETNLKIWKMMREEWYWWIHGLSGLLRKETLWGRRFSEQGCNQALQGIATWLASLASITSVCDGCWWEVNATSSMSTNSLFHQEQWFPNVSHF